MDELVGILVILSTCLKVSGMNPLLRTAMAYIPLVHANISPFNVPKHDIITTTKINVPPTEPNIFWKASFAPVSPLSISISVLTAPARPI